VCSNYSAYVAPASSSLFIHNDTLLLM